MVRFFQIQQTNRMKLRLPFAIRFPVIVFGWWETGNWKVKQMVRKFPPFRSKRKKRSTSEGTPQFLNGISGKLPYHLSSNRNFRMFWPNGKHPRYLFKIFRIDQFQYIKIQPNTIDLRRRPRLWGINPTNSVVIPQDLLLRSTVTPL